MKTQSNMALKGTCNGDVLSGLLLLTEKSLQALLFGKWGAIGQKKAPGVGIPEAKGGQALKKLLLA